MAALLLAGGQGTRLGSADPKGMFPLGLKSGCTLFALQAYRIRRLEMLASVRASKPERCVIPWYIMTSPATDAKTKAYFRENRYFGLRAENVIFFEQAMIPCYDNGGKLLLADKGKVARAPDGNGGLYAAMERAGVLHDMRRRGVKFSHLYCVDNALVKVGDPAFVGLTSLRGVPIGAKTIRKEDPYEKVGVIVKVQGAYAVVEYSEISRTKAEARDYRGLLYAAGNICNHVMTTDFLEECIARNDDLVYHVAKKKIPHVNDRGELVKPSENNGIKLEKFVFDVFAFAKDIVVYEIAREQEFSPLKEPAGKASCTVKHCQQDLHRLHCQWLVAAGAQVPSTRGPDLRADGDPLPEGAICEVHPLASYQGEGLFDFVRQNPLLSFPLFINEAMEK